MNEVIMYATIIVNTDSEWEKFKNWFGKEGWIYIGIGLVLFAVILAIAATQVKKVKNNNGNNNNDK